MSTSGLLSFFLVSESKYVTLKRIVLVCVNSLYLYFYLEENEYLKKRPYSSSAFSTRF